jgi:sphingomyelin phosphodiesterase
MYAIFFLPPASQCYTINPDRSVQGFGLSGNIVECDGLYGSLSPLWAQSLRVMTIPSRNAAILCNTLFSVCDLPAVVPYTVIFPKPKPAPTPRVVSGKKPFKMVHISDIHVDLSYEVGSSSNCTFDICCRADTNSTALNAHDVAGPFGSHSCDSPLSLEESMYAAIEKIVPDNEFVLFTGDLVEGAEWQLTPEEIMNDMNDVHFRMNMGGLKLVYPAVGNHESDPVNSFPARSVVTDSSYQYIYDTLAADWEQWIGPQAADTVRENFGSYSIVHPGSNLKIISINTQFWMRVNFWVYATGNGTDMARDPNGYFAWLVEELQDAEDCGQRVYIIGHMPMGRVDALWDYSQYYDQIIQRYEGIIAAQFFGHTHHDQFEIAYTDYTNQTLANANSITYITSAMTPTSGNPSFRVYDVDPETFAIIDYHIYITNMSNPYYQTIGPIWTHYYSAKSTYGSLLTPPFTDATAELSPAFWHNVTVLMETDDSVFQDYNVRKTRGWEPPACTGVCKETEICQLRSPQSQFNCINTAVNVPTTKKKRAMAAMNGEKEWAQKPDCHHGLMQAFVSGLSFDSEELKRLIKKHISVEMNELS